MATNPRAKTPNDAALSAVEEALRLDFGGPGDDADRGKRPPEPRAPETGRAAGPADAARRSELQRRPETSRVPGPPRRLEQPQPKRAEDCLLYTSPSPRDRTRSRMPSSA